MKPETWKRLVFDQLQSTLTQANELPPTTETVRAFLIGAWSTAPPELAVALEKLVAVIAEPDWKFEGFVALAEAAQ